MTLRRLVAALAAACLLGLGFQTASAGVVGTQDFLAGAERTAHIEKIQSVLARQEVRDELVRLGVEPLTAGERVASLSDQELATVAGKLDELPAGGDLLGVIGVVFVVLLILELTGVIDIFKKI
jgi:hypothetical protein